MIKLSLYHFLLKKNKKMIFIFIKLFLTNLKRNVWRFGKSNVLQRIKEFN